MSSLYSILQVCCSCGLLLLLAESVCGGGKPGQGVDGEVTSAAAAHAPTPSATGPSATNTPSEGGAGPSMANAPASTVSGEPLGSRKQDL